MRNVVFFAFAAVYFTACVFTLAAFIKASAQSCKLLIAGLLQLVIFSLANAILSFFSPIAGIICFTLTHAILVMILRRYLIHSQEELEKSLEQEAELQNKIDVLKNRPNEQFYKMQNLLRACKMLLEKTSEVFTPVELKSNNKTVYEIINQAFKIQFDADGAVILKADDFEDSLAVQSLIGDFPPPYKLPEDILHKKDSIMLNFKHAEFNLKGSIFGETAAAGKIICIEDGSKDSRIFTNGESSFLQHGSLLFLPIMLNKKVISVIGLSKIRGKPAFDSEDISRASIFSDYAAALLNLETTLKENCELNNIKNITESASNIQQILLPKKKLEKIKALDISAYFQPHQGICSDYYDVLEPEAGTVVIALADITGRGLQSAVIMVMIRAILHLIAPTERHPNTVLNWLNKGITKKIDIDHFAAVSILTYIKRENMIEFAAAGYHSMLLWKHKTGKIEFFQNPADPIGVDQDSKYNSIKFPFEKGDVIVLYTDGIIEVFDKNGNQFGKKRLAKVVADNNDLTSCQILTKIEENIKAFIEKTVTHDDRTLLVIKIK